ncbi:MULTISPECIES: MATE family efflux transporter [unclassified Ketobacter]|uniref:MATE family efflux transporter n=1 Tax=unclassified Ketobacter TaxID=2639109 RepID=UPI000F11F7F4|nr:MULTISPECIES: MATE family efflux transporter [unclassified Ketobacter]RLT88830.1 MAG: MATE family efflux transporter [Ketobacter sp. GenoA1]RLT97569.1 MAG: MATE family efflux transporter [Ketobacter sp.]
MTVCAKPFRQECRRILLLAMPIVVAQFAQTANGFVDTVMAGRVSPDDLAAVAVGSAIWVPVFLFLVGVMQGLTPFVSQYRGQRSHQAIGGLVQQGLWLALPLGGLGFLLLRNMEPVLSLMEVDNAIRPMIIAYLQGLSWGFPAITLFLALRSLTEGMSFTTPVMVVSLIGLAVNVPVNYVLIYGKLGFPAMGGVGCGWATSIVMWLMLVLMVQYCVIFDRKQETGLFRRFAWPDSVVLKSILKLGLPIGLSIFIEVSLFCVIALFIAAIGAQVVASHQIALNVASMLFMIPLSLSLALTVRVGTNLGMSNAEGVQRSILSGLAIILVIAVVNSSVMILFRTQVAGIYTDDAVVIEMAAGLLLFAALFQISDCLQVSANGVLRGMKDTAWPMLMTILAYWCLGLPVGYILGLTDWVVPAMGARGFWIGLVAGLTAAAIMLSLRVIWRFRRALPMPA